MKERPIIFNGEEVRAILDGRKTQTRRIVKPQPPSPATDAVTTPNGLASWLIDGGRAAFSLRCPFGAHGDRLWVREAFCYCEPYPSGEDRWSGPSGVPTNDDERHLLDYWRKRVVYRADDAANCDPPRWRSPMHMPRWASRIALEIKNVRVQRLHEISYEDVLAEGWNVKSSRPITDRTAGDDAFDWFRTLWGSLHGPGAFDRNDWVWAITFRRVA